MKNAVVFYVPVDTGNGLAWKWRSEDGEREAAEPFASRADCVADAERNGYAVGRDRARSRKTPERNQN
jgi:hypothetical protein